MTMRTCSPIALVACLLVILGGGPTAQACTCTEPPPPSEAFDGADAVFAGTVVGIEPVGGDYLAVEFHISEVWKGPVVATVIVGTPDSEATCGYSFMLDREELVYAYSWGDPFETGLCTRTKPLALASEDLAWLGDGVLVGSEPAAPELRASLSPNYPNPFSQRTEVEIFLPHARCARLRVYDLVGRLVRNFQQAACAAGRQVVEVDLGEAPAGAYLIELRAGDAVRRQTMTLAR